MLPGQSKLGGSGRTNIAADDADGTGCQGDHALPGESNCMLLTQATNF